MRSQCVLAALLVLGVVLQLSFPPKALAQPTAKTYIVAYNHKEISINDQEAAGYSLLVSDPYFYADHVRRLLRLNPNIIVLRYLNMISMDTSSHGEAWSKDIITHHQDFLLKIRSSKSGSDVPAGKRYAWGYVPAYNHHYAERFFLDPGAVEWRHYYARLAKTVLAKEPLVGTSGIFMDNVWPTITWDFRTAPPELQIDLNGDGKMNADDDKEWARRIIGFSSDIRKDLGDSTILLANFGRRWSRGDEGLNVLGRGDYDGAMNESFARNDVLTSGPSTYHTIAVWKDDVNSLILADSLNRIALMQSLGSEYDTQARLYCFASFLLGEGKRGYFNYRYRVSYDTLYRFPEFDISIGRATENFRDVQEAYDGALRIYHRKFDNGEVFVNPFPESKKLSFEKPVEMLALNGGIIDRKGTISWKKTSTITLQGFEAAVIRLSPINR